MHLLTAAAAALLFQGKAVRTLAYCRVLLVCAYLDAVKCAVTFAVHIVLAGYNIALDRRIFHSRILLDIRTERSFSDTKFSMPDAPFRP